MINRFVPEKVKAFDGKNFVAIEGGQHHTVCLDGEGKSFLSLFRLHMSLDPRNKVFRVSDTN